MSCWVTWERHQRSRSLAERLNFDLVELAVDGGRLRRYLISGWGTLKVLWSQRKQTIFVQAPSVVLALFALAMRRVLRLCVVVDAHNAIVEEAEKLHLVSGLYRAVVRLADRVLVTNDLLAVRVRALGGRPFVLPDPIPKLDVVTAIKRDPKTVMLIATWADDEPMEEVFEAAKLLPPGVRLLVTGKPKGQVREIATGNPSIKLTGYLSHRDYLALLASAGLVVDLTTREDCLVCGAYEAMAVGAPLLVSDTIALRSLLGSGAAYCANTPESIAESIAGCLNDLDGAAARSAQRREDFEGEWNRRAIALEEEFVGLKAA